MQNDLTKNSLEKVEEMRMLLDEILAKNSMELTVKAQVEATKKNMEDPSIDIKEQTKIELKKLVKDRLQERYQQSQKDKELALNYAKVNDTPKNVKPIYKQAAELYEKMGENQRKHVIEKPDEKLVSEYNKPLKKEKKKDEKQPKKKIKEVESGYVPVQEGKHMKPVDNSFLGKIKNMMNKIFYSINSKDNKIKEKKVETKVINYQVIRHEVIHKREEANATIEKKQQMSSAELYRKEVALQKPIAEKLINESRLQEKRDEKQNIQKNNDEEIKVI